MSQQDEMEIEELNFARQVKQYSTGLEETIAKLSQVAKQYRCEPQCQSPIKQLQLMSSRLELELQKYQQALAKMNNKVMSRGGLTSIKAYFGNNYTRLIRESYQVISVCGNRVRGPKQADFRRVKLLEEELDEEWEASTELKGKDTSRGNNSSAFTSFLNLQREKLPELAAAQIQKEFLAIRLASYRLYQEYKEHSHPSVVEQLQVLKQEQEKLGREIGEMKQIRISLLAEERRLAGELAEVKKINQLIGRRYFVESSCADTNFSQQH